MRDNSMLNLCFLLIKVGSIDFALVTDLMVSACRQRLCSVYMYNCVQQYFFSNLLIIFCEQISIEQIKNSSEGHIYIYYPIVTNLILQSSLQVKHVTIFIFRKRVWLRCGFLMSKAPFTFKNALACVQNRNRSQFVFIIDFIFIALKFYIKAKMCMKVSKYARNERKVNN